MIKKNSDGKNSLTNTGTSMGCAHFNLKEFEVWEIFPSE
jgi:hypothetical protein